LSLGGCRACVSNSSPLCEITVEIIRSGDAAGIVLNREGEVLEHQQG